MIDIMEIQFLEFTGKLNKLKHPIFDYFIYSYKKNDYTNNLRAEHECKGVILNSFLNLISYPLGKMELLNEMPSARPRDIEIYEKLDGTFIQLYWFNGIPFLCSRSNFNSYETLLANKHFYDNYSNYFQNLNINYNYFFEYLSPFNKKIVDYYDKTDLYLTGVFDKSTKKYLLPHEISEHSPFPSPTRYTFKNINYNKSEANFEGYVLRENNLVFKKFKFKSYINLTYEKKYIKKCIILNKYCELYPASSLLYP